ncbi:hypothetical protein N7532_008396 [Penicillium argentinense]|uniref:Uncharacterized protein n=1 Tax=Penicillium argentinense TaxID=1131581 RepID=A0A9W9EXB0_9EURO|nr:uncharacterized protein N7532_008396 [Penicillium argentinense]KAJ5089712.1 hypothetical protein N7532_008396 [Penicillium argentinense]
MASVHGSTTHLPTGPLATAAPITADEVQEYERIVKISDAVFAGSHPRLTVPQQIVRKPTARSVQNGASSYQAVRNEASNAMTEDKPLNSEAITNILPSEVSVVENVRVPAIPMAPKTTSEIDPIFLTKSDDLVKAELQLQRQRVERVLRDETEQGKRGSKWKLAPSDMKPEFSVSKVFDQALQIARPVPLGDTSDATGPSDSFDEKSLYSSRAPDSTPPLEEQQNRSPVASAQPTGSVPGGRYADELQRLEALNRTGSDQEMQDAYPQAVADQRAHYSQRQPLAGPVENARWLPESQQSDTLEEPEYSPPAPIAPPIDHRAFEGGLAGDAPRMRYANQSRNAPEPSSPARNVKVVHNHITSPAAPRPSQVSPLATAKAASVQHLRDDVHHGSDRICSDPDTGQNSPTGPAPPIKSRKRRRLLGLEELPPAPPRVKQEPVSPPPFADDPVVPRNRSNREQPIYIDISPQYTPVLERQTLPATQPVFDTGPYREVPADYGPPRTLSRMSTSRSVRDDGDLRRVASMQYARQAVPPREYLSVAPHDGRAASYTITGRSQGRPAYYEEVPYSYGPRYLAVDNMSQSSLGDPYYEEPPRVMAAPRRRIVDEHGTEYEEVIPVQRLQSMAPPPRPVSRMPNAETFNGQVPVRTASVRDQSVAQDPYVGRRYMSEMPPPPQYYRRVPAEYPHPITAERRSYAAPMEGHEPYSRSGSVQVAEYVPRHPTYVDDHTIPTERAMRTTSVRPQPTRYEEPHDMAQRVASVRPSPSREVSVIMNDQHMGGYVERPYYVRERRFYDHEDGDRMELDAAADHVPRVSRHY